jgi:hypothetical protein
MLLGIRVSPMVAEAWVLRAGSYPALRFAEVLRKWIVYYLEKKELKTET